MQLILEILRDLRKLPDSETDLEVHHERIEDDEGWSTITVKRGGRVTGRVKAAVLPKEKAEEIEAMRDRKRKEESLGQ